MIISARISRARGAGKNASGHVVCSTAVTLVYSGRSVSKRFRATDR